MGPEVAEDECTFGPPAPTSRRRTAILIPWGYEWRVGHRVWEARTGMRRRLAEPVDLGVGPPQGRWRVRRIVIVLICAVALVAAVGGTITKRDGAAPPRRQKAVAGSLTETKQACPWLDSQTPVATRVHELLGAMSPYQEATLLHLLSVGTDATSYQGHIPAEPSLCIPEITEQDGAAGVATGFTSVTSAFPDVTQLPAPIVDAAAFDPGLARRYGDVIGAEDAAKGIGLALSPTINIDRSPLWGRSYETLGEDPFLTATLATQLVEGIQANRVVSVVKHYAVYNQETHRGTALDNSIVSDRALHEMYLPAFSAVVQHAHPGAIMCSYNLVNGVPACQNKDLIDTVLRGQWHFDGFVRSDCGSVYDQQAAMAVGVSQAKCTPLYDPTQLATAVADGRLSRSELDALAQPLLTVLFRFDLIANPHPLTPDRPATTPAHRAVAEQTNTEGSVLLKNDRNTLPLALNKLASLALIGPREGTPMPAGFGAMHTRPTEPVSAYDALGAVLGSRLRYDDGADVRRAADVARHAEAAVVVVNDVEAERRDRSTLELPGNQNQLVAAVAAANPRTIVVLETGSAVLMPWLKSVPAVLETWYPGETAGTALVSLLDGQVDPSGKLPVTFPAAQAPSNMPDATLSTFGGVDGRVAYSDGVDVGYRWYQANGMKPLFPFGYGLSYTRFRFSGLKVDPAGSGLNVEATVTNVGSVAGGDVVQCYVGFPSDAGEAPRQLRGYVRVELKPKQSTAVHFALPPGDLATWNSSTGWNVPRGTFQVYVGDGSDVAHLPLSTSVVMQGAALGVNSGPAST